jgi:hypothetical protein
MPTVMIETAEEIILRWLNTPDGDSPAGPLYAAGVFAEADILAPDMAHTTNARCTLCSLCTSSGASGCC